MDVLQLVGDPQRWQLLSLLGESDHRVGDLVELTGRAQNAVSYHLRELRDAGLVSSRRSAADGRDSYYRLDLDRYSELIARAASSLHPGVRFVPTDGPTRPVRRRRPHVLFLCTGNSARSQIAQALVEDISHGTVAASSAGSHPKTLHPNAVRIMAEWGIDIAGRKTKHLDRYVEGRTRFDRVVTLCDKVKEICPKLPGAPRTAHWSMADPAATGADDAATYPAFVATANEIEQRVRMLLAQLAHEPEEDRRAPATATAPAPPPAHR